MLSRRLRYKLDFLRYRHFCLKFILNTVFIIYTPGHAAEGAVSDSKRSSSANTAANKSGQNLIFFKKFWNWLLLIEDLSILELRTDNLIYILLSVVALYWPRYLWIWMNKSISQGPGIDPDMFGVNCLYNPLLRISIFTFHLKSKSKQFYFIKCIYRSERI